MALSRHEDKTLELLEAEMTARIERASRIDAALYAKVRDYIRKLREEA